VILFEPCGIRFLQKLYTFRILCFAWLANYLWRSCGCALAHPHPRTSFPVTAFRERRFRPLSHLSIWYCSNPAGFASYRSCTPSGYFASRGSQTISEGLADVLWHILTLERVSPLPLFESGAFDHSATSPMSTKRTYTSSAHHGYTTLL